jgi:hypothetical protein
MEIERQPILKLFFYSTSHHKIFAESILQGNIGWKSYRVTAPVRTTIPRLLLQQPAILKNH